MAQKNMDLAQSRRPPQPEELPHSTEPLQTSEPLQPTEPVQPTESSQPTEMPQSTKPLQTTELRQTTEPRQTTVPRQTTESSLSSTLLELGPHPPSLRPAWRIQPIRRCCGLRRQRQGMRTGFSIYDKYWNATLRIYNESECQRAREHGIYIIMYWLIWILVATQLLISALITAFAASGTGTSGAGKKNLPTAGLGGATCIITSFLGMLKAEPERRWRKSLEYERVMDIINDQSDYFAFVNESQLGDEPTAAINRAYDAYKTAKQNATLNRPGDLGQVSRGKESKGKESKDASENV